MLGSKHFLQRKNECSLFLTLQRTRGADCRDLVDDLLSAVDQPLKVAPHAFTLRCAVLTKVMAVKVMKCPETNKEFILCDYNRKLHFLTKHFL
eukprot:188618-Rhodomonas_salina.1